MGKRLTGSAGTGDKILSNLKLFRHQLDQEKSKGDFYSYKVIFDGQTGSFNFSVINGEVVDANLDMSGFAKILGLHNDSSLKRVANYIRM